MDYTINIPIRGSKTLLVKNCKSKSDARRKLLDFDNGQPDCEGIDWNIDYIFFKQGKFYETIKSPNKPLNSDLEKCRAG